MPSLCRDCLAPLPDPAPKRCPDCNRARILSHAELDSLSIAHIDCDAFYASVEKRDNPALSSKPLIIGGGTRGGCHHLLLYRADLGRALGDADV